MTNLDLPDADRVVRYVRPSLVRSDGSVRGAAFGLRTDEVGLSVNWAPIRFVNMPLEVADQHDADPSHTEITPLPPHLSPEADFVGNMIARSITNVIAAVN